MKKVKQYLDEAADRGLVKNDSELAARLGITRQSVSAWRKGDACPDPDQAAALASMLGRPEVLAECMAARAKKPENRAMWERAANALRMTAALGIMGGVVLYTTAFVLQAAPVLASAVAVSALCEVLRRRRERRKNRTQAHVGPLRRWSDQYRTHGVQQKRIDPRRKKPRLLAPNAPLPGAQAGA
jgi:transcriptional regulator with XRE-family HTH domain